MKRDGASMMTEYAEYGWFELFFKGLLKSGKTYRRNLN